MRRREAARSRQSPLPMKHLLLLWALSLAAPVPGLLAQESAAPFSTLSLYAGPAADARSGDLEEFWEARHGYLLRLSTPFYFGSATAGFQDTFLEARSLEQPDFDMRTFTIEWSASAAMPARATLFGGVHAGAAAMHFHERVETFNGDENEFLLGAQAGIRLPVAGGFGLAATASHRKVFTRLPLRLTAVSVGIDYTVRTPAALREVLQ